MNAKSLIIVETPTGKFKVKVWGQPDDHFMDWDGCNYRTATVPGQPHRGFRKPVEAVRWAKNTFKTDREAFDTIEGDGTFFPDDFTSFETFDLGDPKAEQRIDEVNCWEIFAWFGCDDCGSDLDENETCPDCGRNFKGG